MTSHRLHVVLEAEFPLERLSGRVRFAESAKRSAVDLVLVDGVFDGHLEDRPQHFFLIDPMDLETKDAVGDAQHAGPAPRETGTGPEVDVVRLFTAGVPVPDSGELRLRLAWGNCHNPDGRYLGEEHRICAERIGQPAPGSNEPASRYVNPNTELPCGATTLTYGEIIALAGDHFAFYDEAAHQALRQAWPDPQGLAAVIAGQDYRRPYLVEADPDEVDTIAERPDASAPLLHDSRRFLALAAHNYCHFAHQLSVGGIGNDANLPLTCYRYYHDRARRMAAAGHGDVQQFHAALALDAFGCHFLTDLFASGHLRVPRRQLALHGGLFLGSLWRSKRMHDEDNKLGLLVTTRHCFAPRWVWRTYGDGWLLFEPEQTNQGGRHKWMVQESVRRSVADIERAWLGLPPLLGGDGAEALLPIVLPVGEAPKPDDVVPFTDEAVRGLASNFPPMFMMGKDEQGRDVLLQRLDWKPGGTSSRFRSLGPLPE